MNISGERGPGTHIIDDPVNEAPRPRSVAIAGKSVLLMPLKATVFLAPSSSAVSWAKSLGPSMEPMFPGSAIPRAKITITSPHLPLARSSRVVVMKKVLPTMVSIVPITLFAMLRGL